MKTNKRRIKPLVIAAAVAATAAVSMVSVNAATDGQLVEKISLFINGKEQDIDNSNIKKGVDENGDQYYEFHVNEDGVTFCRVERCKALRPVIIFFHFYSPFLPDIL